MQSLVISLVRFSTASALFGLDQLQSAVDGSLGGRGLSAWSLELAHTFDEMSARIECRIGDRQRTTLESINHAGNRMVDSALRVMSPRRIFRVSYKLLLGTARFLATPEGAPPEAEGEPQLAVDALSYH